MNAMLSIVAGNVKHQARRFLGPALGVLLGTLFVTTSLVLGSSLQGSIYSSLSGDYGAYAAIVTPKGEAGTLTNSDLERVRQAPGVKRAYGMLQAGASADNSAFLLLNTNPRPTSRVILTKGHLPSGPGEVALSLQSAKSTASSLGDTLTISAFEPGQTKHRVRVVGLVDVGRDSRYGPQAPVAFGTTTAVQTWSGEKRLSEIDVTAADGVSDENVVAAVQNVVPKNKVLTGKAMAKEMADGQLGGGKLLSGFLLGFAGIAVFVSMLVISNTFAILLARRRRETALLRSVGATREQVVMGGLVEAGIVGLVASVAGIAVGIGASWAAVRVLDSLVTSGDLSLVVPWYAYLVPLVVGVLTTAVAALWPVVRAARISPLAALRPEEGATATNRPGRVRLVLGALALMLGAVLLVLGSVLPNLGVSMLGGMLSFIGVTLIGPLLIPAMVQLLSLPARALLRNRPAAVPTELAVENTVRSPGRAAATANALLVGVTLVVMTLVGGATARASVDAELSENLPIDVSVSVRGDGVLPAGTAASLQRVAGIGSVTSVKQAAFTVTGAPRPVRGTQQGLVVDDAARAVTRNSRALEPLQPGTILINTGTRSQTGLKNGSVVTLIGPRGTVKAHVAVNNDFGYAWMITPQDAATLGSKQTLASVWGQLKDGPDVNTVMNDARDAIPAGTLLGGAASYRAQLYRAMDLAIGIVAGLLAVSVIIALIGVANTLSLSAIERSRESALLRALGLTRGQLRTSLGIEGVLLSTVGAVVGVVLGVIYGWLGIRAILGDLGTTVLSVPWLPILGVLAVAVLAGLLASILPGRAAARMAPAAVLAAE